MVLDDQDTVIEGEELEVPVSGEDQANALLSLEELIKNHIEAIDKLKIELKTQREMYEDSFNTNPTYHEHIEKVKDVRFDMNEQSKTLSDLLQDYTEQTGATSIETRDGKVLEIVRTSRLV